MARDGTVALPTIIVVPSALLLVSALTSPTLTFGGALFFLVIYVISVLLLVLALVILIILLGTFEMDFPINLNMIRNVVVVHWIICIKRIQVLVLL